MINRIRGVFTTTLNCFKIPELQHRIIFTVAVLFVVRLISLIPVPGLDGALLTEFLKESAAKNDNSLLGMYSLFTGGALERCGIGSLGIMPYISATIIIQLLTAVLPGLSKMAREEGGRSKVIQIGRYLTVLLCLGQGFFMSLGWEKPEALFPGFAGNLVLFSPDYIWAYRLQTVLVLTTGTLLLMWLGEQITERGIGNGISILIFAGIVAGLPTAIGQTAEQARQGDINLLFLLLIGVIVIALTYLVVFVERGQRRIVVNYAKRQQGRQVFAAQSTHLPLKVNIAGVIPPIFASSIILFPGTIAGWFGQNESTAWLQDVALMLSPGQPLYVMLYAAAIIFFCFFYTALVFNPRDTADNLKKSGAFIPGIRPGEQTSRYIDKVMTRLTLAGALYITFICLVPEFMLIAWNVPFYFGGTSLLIIVVVIMDFMAQVQTHLMSSQYESVLKKANLKGYGR